MANNLSPLPGTVQKAPAGLSGFDINSIVSTAVAQSLKDAGYAFCIRYIPRTANLAAGNLSNTEALHILNAGLALMAVQHVALPGWAPTAALGAAYGSYAASYCKDTVGLPVGINIWLDLEGVGHASPAQDVIDYCQAWYNEVDSAGYIPGIYVGYDTILDSQQLYSKLSFKHYWRAYNGPVVNVRGFQMIQHTEKVIQGITIDPNTTQIDKLGDTVSWLAVVASDTLA